MSEVKKRQSKRKRESNIIPLKKIRKKNLRDSPELKPPFVLKNIKDLLNIAWNYKGEEFEWFTLWNMIPELTELDELVGMNNIKEKIIDLILYYLQGLHMNGDKMSESDMLHTVLCGSPGTGKTTLAHIFAKIYCKLGFLPTDNVVVAKRSDFIGRYIGHSESQTIEILESSLGGVLFIDEAYGMGQEERPDSFSKASIDLINSFLSEHSHEMVCIIAGYERELETCFFSMNSGLCSRFPWKFTIENYGAGDLFEMFKRKVQKEDWTLEESSIDEKFFAKHLSSFPFFGRDVSNFFTFCKTLHSRRIFGTTEIKKLLTKQDIEKGIISFSKQRKKAELSDAAKSMFN